MKKIIYSMLVIVTTIITSYILIKNSYGYDYGYDKVQEMNSVKKDMVIENVRNEKNVSKESPVIEKPESTAKKEEAKVSSLKEKASPIEKKVSPKEEETSTSADISVFKVSKENIKKTLSFADKERILYIAAKLSKEDYNEAYEYLQNSNDEVAVITTIKFLKSRLSKSDYEKLRKITEKYLNMDLIEKDN